MRAIVSATAYTENCVKRDLAGVAGAGRTSVRDGGVETGGVEGSQTGSVTKKGIQKSTIGIGASLATDFRDKDESNNNNNNNNNNYNMLTTLIMMLFGLGFQSTSPQLCTCV